MAELEIADEIFDELSEGIEGEAAGEEGEVAEEVKAEAEEASENVSLLKRGVEWLKKLNVPQVVISFAKFVVENAAMGAVLYGVNVVLAKAFGKASGGEKGTVQEKQNKVKAVAQLTSDVAKALNKLADWTKAKENDRVEIVDGICVPVPDFLSKFTQPMGKSVETAFDISKQLIKKQGGSAKPTFVVPTTDQVNQMLDSSEAILSSLKNIITFVNDKKQKYPVLGTLPIQESDVQKLEDDMEKVKKLPYA